MSVPIEPPWLDARLLASHSTTEAPIPLGERRRGFITSILKRIETPAVGVSALLLMIASIVLAFTDLIPSAPVRDGKTAATSRYMPSDSEPIAQNTLVVAPSINTPAAVAAMPPGESQALSTGRAAQPTDGAPVGVENGQIDLPRSAPGQHLSDGRAAQTTTVSLEPGAVAKTESDEPPLVREGSTRTKNAAAGSARTRIMVRYKRPILRNGRLVLWHGAWREESGRDGTPSNAVKIVEEPAASRVTSTPLNQDLSPNY